ncbi:TIGR02281 family clan AA aspartic protease [Sphingomonas psychrotolerans]|uniref:TIGR02281 family clan AA aspartic protease n=1 Tax=Sphingomonas psychrotolerans TaxID=1327635 RepID=A0ABU3N0A3_9SPHN|nr:TIGR02281 family clan AA aspartic protease [Sphingomonas psychrotolerans]MDT8757984.1 TIGR02281 family clan AA aspartic protease [Sphingomonas psychrotolerans]
MSEWDSMDLIYLVGVLVLVLSALSIRKLSIGFVLRSLVTWALIIVLTVLAVAHRHELGALFAAASAKLGIDDQQVDGGTVRIRMAPDGHFWARVRLNGVERRMLIDSGATITAISDRTAAAADVTAGSGLPVMIETANGTVAARRGRIQKLAIGPLKTEDLGVVVSESFGELDVLGMNFLSRLHSWRVENNVLVLQPKAEANDSGTDVTTPPAKSRERRRAQAESDS